MAQKIKTECSSCSGTGLYSGFAEPDGVAVVCLTCNGSGCQEITYEPFVRRKDRQGIRRVCRSAGSFIGTGVGPDGPSISYAEFQQGKMP